MIMEWLCLWLTCMSVVNLTFSCSILLTQQYSVRSAVRTADLSLQC